MFYFYQAKMFPINKSYFKKRIKLLIFLLSKWAAIIILTGLLAGLSSALFLWLLTVVSAYRETHFWIIVFLPLAGMGIGLLYWYKGAGVEEGNNLLIQTINQPEKIIPFKMAPLVFAGTIITHLFGGSAGREGAALQMSASMSDQLSGIFKLTAEDRKILITAAVAAGFGAVFGTPLAGVVFAIEFSLKGKINYRAFVPAIAAAFLADWVTRFCGISHTYYYIGALPALHFLSVFYSIIAGLAFGITSWLFVKLLHHSTIFFKTSFTFSPLQAFAGGCLVIIAVFVAGSTTYIGLGIATILQSFQMQMPWYYFLLKILFTVITLGAGFKGGEATPLFFIGALAGNSLSYFLPLPVALLAGMGFVSVFAGATRTPIACIIMAMEMFGSNCGFYVAIACVAARLICGRQTIYKS